MPKKSNAHPGLKLRHTLRGHEKYVYRMALSPDGRMLASPSQDQTVRIWDINRGTLLRTIKGHTTPVCVAWSPDPDKQVLVSGDYFETIRLWNPETGELLRILKGHTDVIESFAWSPDGNILASGSFDTTIRLWNAETGQTLKILEGHISCVESVAWSPDGRTLCSGSWDNTVRLWNAKTGKKIRAFGASDSVKSVAWSPDGQHIASGSEDKTVRIWNPETGQQTNILEMHTDEVISVSFFDNGRLLGSLSKNDTLVIWRTDTWTEVAHVDKIGIAGFLSNLAIHPTLPVMAAPGEIWNEINIWELDFNALLGTIPSTPAIHYINAKVVLVGDSGVGKSGLGIRIAENEFRTTESSHGAQFWQIPVPEGVVRDEKLPNMQAELTLWDLAGQPEYRLVHQLFLDDTDAALLLFDCSDPNDPFRGVPYWAKVLKKHAPSHVTKLLVSARCDVSPVTVDQQQINDILAKYKLNRHFITSAKEGDGVEALLQHVLEGIPWDKIPRTSTPRLFQVIREFLLEQKESGETLISMSVIQKEVTQRYTERPASQAEIDTVISLLQARGFIHRLAPRADMTLILMRPELINQYASSIIQAARNHPVGIGAVSERNVLIGKLPFSGFERLPQEQERIVLEATAELLIRHDLCFREMGFLVFPSQINVTRPAPPEAHPRTEVAYRFSGSIETIYASLVVRLSYTDHFQREDQWKYAVEFSRDRQRLGFSMRQVEEGTGELEIYFDTGISDSDRITFIRFVTDHLRTKGIDIQEQIRLYCTKCGEEVKNRKAIEARVNTRKLDVPCQFCGTAVFIPKSIEECYQRDRSLVEKQRKLVETVTKRTDKEIEEFKADQEQYKQEEDHRIHILHLSDIHLETESQARKYRMQLETDLKNELDVKRLEYLVISGDIANHSTEEEYKAAFELVDGLVKRFGLDAGRVVIVPGNHDLNQQLSKKAYPFIYNGELPDPLPEGMYIPAGEEGVLLRDDELYQKRFDLFSTHFYKKVYSGKEYPLDYAEQSMIIERHEDKILFLALNSCWQIDHHFDQRAGINTDALSRAHDRLQDEKYDNWLKIAVWHHPVTGKEPMNDEFLQYLSVHNFQICMHGHIHEAMEGFYKYDDRRGIHIIGAGTFGAPTNEQVPGIPLQYNLLTFDPDERTITVNTRKKEKPGGAWSADARWGDKNRPDPFYVIKLG
jgi:small GTP-binding protein